MLKWFVIFYYGYCLVYFLFGILKRRENGLIKAILMTFFPIFGMILSFYLFKPAKISTAQKGIKEEISGSLPQIFHKADAEDEVVPLQDALLLNDNQTKRKLLINSLKDNSIHNPDILLTALKNEDTETSHYAATAIMEMKRKLLNSIQEIGEKLEERPNDPPLLIAYAEVVQNYINSGFLDQGSLAQYQTHLSKVLTEILKSDEMDKQYFILKVNCDLDLRDYESAQYYSEEFLKEYPLEEMAYIMAIKVQYAMRNPSGIRRLIEILKKHPVHLSAKGLSIIRYWT